MYYAINSDVVQGMRKGTDTHPKDTDYFQRMGRSRAGGIKIRMGFH